MPDYKKTFSSSDLDTKKDFYIGLGFSVVFVAAFNWMWLANYFPVTEGWFSAYAHRWINGYLPYRDTGLFLPPLYTWQIYLWEILFGPSLWSLRFLGLLATSTLSATAYLLLRRFTSSIGAAAAAVIAVLCFESFNVFIPYDYHTFDTLYAAVSVLFLVKSFESRVPGALPGREQSFLFLSGFFVACCLLVKHSMGGILFFAVFLMYLAGCFGEKLSMSFRRLLLLGLGFAVPVLAFLLWLFVYSSPGGFYKCVVLGVGAKGSLPSILFGFLRLQFTLPFTLQLIAAFVLLFFINKFRAPESPWRNSKLGWLGFASVGFFVVWHHFVPHLHLPKIILSLHFRASQFVVPLAIAATFFALVRGIPWGWRPLRKSDLNLFAVAALSCCFMYSTAVSTLISAPGAFLGVGLAVSLVWNKVIGFTRMSAVFLAILVFYADATVAAKYARPYYWWNISAPDVRTGLAKFTAPILRGISTSPDNKNAIEGATRIIVENTVPGDSIFAYPSIPIFYLLSDRWPSTYFLQHWYDTVGDAGAMEDLARLKSNPPKVIVLLVLPEDAVMVHERLFRGGKVSAQREIAGWINAQVEEGNYKIAADFSLGSGTALRVFNRI